MVAGFDYDIDSKRYLAHGINVFQANLLNDSEEDTVQMIHDLLQPHDDSIILDFGAGCAGVEKLMLKINDSLKFICLTNSKFQAQYIDDLNSKSIAALHCDFHNVPLPDCSVDFIMFNETIGYGDLGKLVCEAKRLLKKGGRILIKDFLNYFDYEVTRLVSDVWGYTVYLPDDFLSAMNHERFLIEYANILTASSKRFASFIANDPYMNAKYNSDSNIIFNEHTNTITSLIIVASK